MTPYVGVVGPGDAQPALERLAYEVGERLARAGAVVLCGGLGGVMAAAAGGAAAGGGTSIGLLPGTDRTTGAEALTYALTTGLGELRNGLLVSASDGLVAVGSSWGTLNEVALAVRLGKPVVALRGWRITDDGADVTGIVTADSAEHAVTRLLHLLA
ncbi:MAG: hypothetical protein QOI76_3608 [Frankiales bacterium]|jgi:uncharacterized protein (TIGR00725 family)|nr:hypothetical protein [Frankiales bacterium]